MGPDEQALITKIETAFADEKYPGDDYLVESSYGDEATSLIDSFRGKTDWRRLPATFLDTAVDGSALAFFSGAALRFYLAAYLRADVRGELSRASPEVRLTWSLTQQSEGQRLAEAWGGGTMLERAKRCFEQFNSQQAAAVTEYLEWKLAQLGGDPCIEDALANYWRPRARGVGP